MAVVFALSRCTTSTRRYVSKTERSYELNRTLKAPIGTVMFSYEHKQYKAPSYWAWLAGSWWPTREEHITEAERRDMGLPSDPRRVTGCGKGWEKTEKCFRDEFIYQGRSGNLVHFIFKKYLKEIAWPAMNEPFQHDIGVSNIVVFRGYRIEIIEANEDRIVCRILDEPSISSD
jgi:hypothetical protein